jgi:hypothetical protein
LESWRNALEVPSEIKVVIKECSTVNVIAQEKLIVYRYVLLLRNQS